MLFDITQEADVSLYVSRKKNLLSLIKQELSGTEKSIVLLFADFENDNHVFQQESSFFYVTGSKEPGVVLLCTIDGDSTLYVPNFAGNRAQWMDSCVPLVQENADRLGVDNITLLGEQCQGYQLHPFFSQKQYKNLLTSIKQVVDAGGKVFTFNPKNAHGYVQQRLVLERIKNFIPGLAQHVVDISPLVARMRRKKDTHEIEHLYEAINITTMAHEAAAQAIEKGILECEVQGALEYIFTASGADKAFPSIVAGGKNGTILHYVTNSAELQNGDLVVVDIGAKMNGYCADLTRTYPVSGTFTPRQRELYDIVLATQSYIAQEARPGMWLVNPNQESKSLHHLAKKFLKAKGLEKYFPHGLGHFMGLDVHDVGEITRPLQEGDVFTIEPGVYIPEEGIGIRIEDDFWMVKDGVVCLSEDLPREAEDIEKMMVRD